MSSDAELVEYAESVQLLDANTMALRQIIHHAVQEQLPMLEGGIGIGFALWRIEFGGVVYQLELRAHSAVTQDRSKPS
jgi:hypothetical protein